MLNPIARGVFLQGFIGAVFAGDNVAFPFLVFSAHYTIMWMASTINTLPPTEMLDYILGWYAFFTFAYGAFAGQLVVYAMRTRPLVPTFTMLDKSPRLAPALSVFFATVVVRASTIISGAANTGTVFFNLDQGDVIGYGIALGIAAVLFMTIMILTWTQHAPSKMWKWVSFSYRDDLQSNIIPEYIIAVILMLAPQAIWNYLILPPTSWSVEVAAISTILVEALVWVGFYYWFSRVRHVEQTHFSHKNSYVQFHEFVLIVGIAQIAYGIFYLVVGYFGSFPEMAVTIMVVVTILVAVALYIGFGIRRINQRKENATKDHTSDVDPFEQTPPTTMGTKILKIPK